MTFDKLPIIFQGNIQEAYSQRQGTEWVTEIEGYDGGVDTANSTVNQTVEGGSPLSNILKTLISSFQNVSLGAVGNFTGETQRATVLTGPTMDIFKYLTNERFFIDNEKLYIMHDNEVITGEIDVINADNGLL